FEIPLLIAMLNVAGVLSYATLARSRRGLIMGIFVFAAVASPGQAPFSMLALALAVCVLVEGSIQFARLRDKRTKKEREEWRDDDSASPRGGSGAVQRSGPVPAAQPVSDSADGTWPLRAPAGGSSDDDVL